MNTATLTVLPSFLTPQHQHQEEDGTRLAVAQLELQTFEIAFEHLLLAIRDGETLTFFVANHTTPIDAASFRYWVMANPKRKQAYREAQEIGAEAISDTLIRIADGVGPDGTPSPEDVSRSTLKINTRRKAMEYMNRKRFGDVKQIEQTTKTTIDVSTMNINDLKRQVMIENGLLSEDGEVVDG